MSFPRSRIGAVPCRTYGTQEGCQFGNSCTFRHGEETQQQAQERQHAAYMATKNSGGGGGGGGGHVSPTHVARVPVEAPGAPARAKTYAQRMQPKPEMPEWMVMGKKLEGEFNMIAQAEAAYKHAVETAIAAKKAAEARMEADMAAAKARYDAAIGAVRFVPSTPDEDSLQKLGENAQPINWGDAQAEGEEEEEKKSGGGAGI